MDTIIAIARGAHEEADYMSTQTIKTATLVALAFLAVFGMLFAFTLPEEALAWDDCPRGEVDCVYPGECSRYIDTNGDGICDLSQPEPVATTATAAPPASVVTPTTAAPPAAPALTDDQPAEESSIVSTTEGGGRRRGSGTVVAATGSVTTTTTLPPAGTVDEVAVAPESAALPAAAAAAGAIGGDSGRPSFFTHYFVSPIALAFFLIYGVSFFLYKTKRIRIATHRKIWNVLLLGTFLVTGVFGVILTIQLDYELPFTIPVDLLFWHVEAGIAMTFISLFHTGWHFKYYRNLLRTSRSKARTAEAAERAAARTGAAGRAKQRDPRAPVPRPYTEWET